MSASTDLSHKGGLSLQFCDMQWLIDITPFWDTVRELKLREWKRDEPCVANTGTITIDVRPTARSSPVNAVFFDGTSVAATPVSPHVGTAEADTVQRGVPSVVHCHVPGTLLNFNHYENFVGEDAKRVLQEAVWRQLLVPLWLHSDPGSASTVWQRAPYLFSLIRAFADIKGYVYHHREAFPAVIFRGSSWNVRATALGGHQSDACPIAPVSVEDTARICSFLSDMVRGDMAHPFAPVLCHWSPDLTVEPFTPERWQACTRERTVRDPVVAFHDVSGQAACLGWPALNFLTCVRLLCPNASGISVYAVRKASTATSLYLELTCNPVPLDAQATLYTWQQNVVAEPTQSCPADFGAVFTVTGWKSKKPVALDLSRDRDPARRAAEDSKLNLRLMKWQQQPNLELEKLSSCKALLLGAGTLGCHVARNLLCWGVHHITLVDRGHVSFSNLARQSLFTVDDASAHRHKAMAAAAALNRIIPAPETIRGVDLHIHMPGYRIEEDTADVVRREVEALAQLIQSHDVVFLLTDSREARWLPTVLTAAHGVPAINVAIGFSGFEVQRHGIVRAHSRQMNGAPATFAHGADRMGCYFCGKLDPVLNTMARRTLDRQCSVTRPGVSALASSTATELLAAVYQHPQGFLCAHSTDTHGTALGAVPQMVIGEVGGYTTRTVTCERGELCEACSEPILHGYELEGTSFLMRCLDDSDYLDTVCGMKALRDMCEANVLSLAADLQPPDDTAATRSPSYLSKSSLESADDGFRLV